MIHESNCSVEEEVVSICYWYPTGEEDRRKKEEDGPKEGEE